MKILFHRLSMLLNNLAQFHHLNRSSQIIILLHLFYCLADGLSNIFVSIYIWKLHQNLSHVAWFYFYQSLAFLLLGIGAGKRIKRYSPQFGIGCGTFFLSVFYFSLLFLQDQAPQYLPLLGFLQGMGMLFYWTSFHLFVLSLTNDKERHLYNGYVEASASISNLITPLIAGGVIISFGGNKGYTVIFLLSFLFFLATTVLSSFIRLPRAPKQAFKIKSILHDSIRPQKKWFWGMQANFIQGLSDTIFQMMPGVIYFHFFHHEWNLGLMTSFLAVLTLFSNFLVGRLLPLQYRNQSILLATLIHACCASIFSFHPSWIAIFLFGLGNSLVKPWYFIPSLSAFFDYFDRKPEKEERYVEYLVARELALSLGRILSLMLLLWLTRHFSNEQQSLQWFNLFISLGLPYIWFAVRQLQRKQQ